MGVPTPYNNIRSHKSDFVGPKGGYVHTDWYPNQKIILSYDTVRVHQPQKIYLGGTRVIKLLLGKDTATGGVLYLGWGVGGG